MTGIAILQARTNSSRLPGKALLPVNGIPMAVLAAKRAANTGRKVIVATSSLSSDDELAAIIKSQDITCYRGDLDNVLSRFVGALADFSDEEIVFRLTADNVFPDGWLLDEMEDEFVSRGLEYLRCNGMESGLPYGMCVEVTRLRHLREAADRSSTTYDKEHVTPYIIRKFGLEHFKRYRSMGKGHFRCTVDNLDDYTGIQIVFSNVKDPIHELCISLVDRLKNAPYQPFVNSPVNRLVLGTAQFGSHYGIANIAGQPNKIGCKELIKTAIANGVTYLDTARAYGESEDVIGYALADGWGGRVKIITKLSPLRDCPTGAPDKTVHAFVDASIFQSTTALGFKCLDVLMLHRFSHLTAWNGAAWQRLLHHQAEGVIGELGVSIQNPEELVLALKTPQISHIQMPFNLMDWRWNRMIPEIIAAKTSRRLIVHVRSALLQGLLLSKNEQHWLRANVEASSRVISWLSNQAGEFQRNGIADLCLAYVNAMTWVDGISLGVDNMDQLIENIKYFIRPPLSNDQINKVCETRPKLADTTLNPAFWRN